MTQVKGWRKKGSSRAKWSDAQISMGFRSRSDINPDVIGFSIVKPAKDWSQKDDVVDIKMGVKEATELRDMLTRFIDLSHMDKKD